MLQSMNLDSIPDDALFESGTEAWNPTLTLPSVSRQQTLGNRTNTMTLQNQEETRNIPGIVAQGVNMERQELGRRQVLQPVAQQTRPTTPPEALMAVFEPSYENVQPIGNGGARAKTTKNKENKNKNSAMKRSGFTINGPDADRRSQSPSKSFQAKFTPALRYKRYDNEDEGTGSDLTNRKVVNQSKQSKQNINRNEARNQTGQLTSSNSDTDTLINYASIPLPAGLDPASNPRNIDHIYLKNTGNRQQNRQTRHDNDLETDFFSVHQLGRDANKGQNSSQRILDTPNITHIHNNLWEDQNKEKNKGTKNVTHVVLDDHGQNNAVHVIQNDLDIDSLPSDRSTTIVKLTSNLSLPRPSSDSRLESPSIVVPYEHNALADNALQMNSLSANAGSSPNSIVSTISFNTSPTSTFTNSLIQDSLNFSDSLPTSLSSNVLFGDGVSNDYIYAQKLQQQYDREHEALQSRRQYDIPPNNRSYIIPAEEHFNQHTARIPTQNDEEGFYTADYTTANEFPTLGDSLTNDIDPVYDPNDDDRPTRAHEPVYVHVDNQADSRAETENNADENTRASSSEIVIPHQIESDEAYPQSYAPREPIVVRFNEASDMISPSELSLEASDSLVARGSGTRLAVGQVDDAEYARRIQEQQDEELARMLQEQEGEVEHHHGNRVNLVNFERNNTRRNYQPLHTRFGHTWTNRPLRVGPPIGGATNNVADSRVRSRNTWDRPLQQRQAEENEFAYLDNVHSVPVNEGYDIPPGQDYYYRYQNDPDFMLDEYGEDRLISINRDPRLLATLLMTRAPDMMVPNDIDLNDYEALWELAENLGEVRRVGMDQTDVSLLPVHKYKAPTCSDSEDNKTDCLVCLSEFSEGERLRTLPCCHIYHVDCIDEWLRRNAICPVCRQSAVQRQ